MTSLRRVLRISLMTQPKIRKMRRRVAYSCHNWASKLALRSKAGW